MEMKTYPMIIEDGHVYAKMTLRDVVEKCDVSDLPILSEVKRLYDENAKLRELVIDFDKCLDTAVYLAGVNGFATMPSQELFDSLRPRMQELGVVL